MVPCRTLADTQGFGDALGVVAAGGEPQDLLGHLGAALGTGEGAGGEDQRQRYQRRNQGAARIELNTIPCEALAWNRPSEVIKAWPTSSSQLSRTRNPVNHLTRGITTNQFPLPTKQMILFNGSCSRN